MLFDRLSVFGDKKMKDCVECGKKLGILEGYRHPTMGQKHLVCSDCFDTVFGSIEKYREFISPYHGFFNKETSIKDDVQQITELMITRMQRLHNKIGKLGFYKATQDTNESVSATN